MKPRTGKALLRLLITCVLAIVVIAAVLAAYRYFSAPTVTVTEVVMGPVVQAFYATGTLQPDREYPIRSNVEGILMPIQEPVDKGSFVAKGQVLAVVRVEEYLLRHSQAQVEHELKQQLAEENTSPILLEFDARIQAAKEQLDVSEREWNRVKLLFESKVASQSDYDRVTEHRQSAWSLVQSLKAQRATRKLELQRDLAVTRAALDIAQWYLDQQTIRSPIAGIVLDRPVSIGTRVKINDTLMHVADVNPQAMVMRSQIDEEDKTRVSLNQQVHVSLYSYGDRLTPFLGRVKRIYPKADPDRRTFEVDVAIDNADDRFAAGMTGELAFVVNAREQTMVVPSQAVQWRDVSPAASSDTNHGSTPGTSGAPKTQPAASSLLRAARVWVVQEQKAEARNVKVGIRSVERTEILEGLQPGDMVIISPADRLSAGQKVEVVHQDPRQAAALNKPAEEKAMKGFN